MADPISITSFVFGVGSTLAAFLATNIVQHAYEGRKFRERISSDIEGMMRNYRDHRPTLGKDYREFERLLKEAPDKDRLQYRKIIWSNTFSLLPHVLENSAHLRAPAFNACVEFYDVYGRLEEIRKAHNDAICRAATSTEGQGVNLAFALHCLKELESEYESLIDAGYRALRQLETHYSLSRIDQRLLSSWEAELSKKPGTNGVLTVAA